MSNKFISFATALSLLTSTTFTYGEVVPPSIEAELEPGDSVVLDKMVTTPAITPKLDLLLVVDLSGSYYDDLPNIKALAPELFDEIRAAVPDSQFGLATFVDFPFGSWGGGTDYAYRLDSDMTADRTTWLSAVDAMSTRSGGDFPESQYEALYQAATGYGREMPTTTNDDYSDQGEIPPGQNATFRDDATRIIAITTDASFHEGGDSGGVSFSYPGATGAETIAALQAAGIKVIAIKAGSASTQMDELADETGGSVVTTSNNSAEIANAILEGLEHITFTVSAQPSAACAPLEFTYEPEFYTDVPNGTTVIFEETITVPLDITQSDLDDDYKIACEVDFLADDTVIGVQEVSIVVPLNGPPVAMCQNLLLDADDTCSGIGDVNAGSYDPDGDEITLDYSDPGPYPVGTTLVTLTVTDEFGEKDSCDATVTVSDVTPPTITMPYMATTIWPPNHKYKSFGLADCGAQVLDSCGGEIDISSVGIITSIYSDELENAGNNGDGNTVDDIVITSLTSFDVRAERSGNENGRVYGILFEVNDGSGNVSEAECRIGVPFSQNGDAPIDDGPVYVVYP